MSARSIPRILRPRLEDQGEEFYDLQFPDITGKGQYETQMYARLPLSLGVDFGLSAEWGFRLQEPKKFCVFIQTDIARPDQLQLPTVRVFEPYTHAVRLKVVGGFAIALIDLDREVSLEDCYGKMTVCISDPWYLARE